MNLLIDFKYQVGCPLFFQHQSVPDIIKEVCNGLGFTDIDDKLTASYRTWEYCVQYRESDFCFLSRLMEQEGIYYYFTHEEGKHTLNLADGYGSHEPVSGYEVLEYYPPDDTVVRDDKRINGWNVSKKIQPGTYVLTDYDFIKPKADLKVNSTVTRPHSEAEHEVFDYPGEYADNGDGNKYVRTRIEELHSQYEQVQGEGIAKGLMSGGLFSLENYPREDQNKEYLVVSVTHTMHSDAFEAGQGGGASYANHFTVIESGTPYRTARSTQKPIVQGPQTAVVVGPGGEEIYTDEHGQVKLQFHWDRYGESDENSSCWVRVSQLWAGKQWGSIYIPRIGQEVIVDFIEGDPDRPIVTGRVYNGDCTPPYDLPANKTVSTTKTNSSKGGQGFNEIRFEDKKGKEQIFVHAEKDKDTRIKNTEQKWIGNEKHLIIEKNEYEHIKEDKHLTVDGDQVEKVEGTVSRKIAMDLQEKVGNSAALEAGTEIHLKAGMKVVLEAGAQISLKVGGNFIDINPAGIFIKGTMVMINSGGRAGSGSGSSPDKVKLPKTAPNAKPGEVEKADANKARKTPDSRAPRNSRGFSNLQAQSLSEAAENATPFCEQCAAAAAAKG